MTGRRVDESTVIDELLGYDEHAIRWRNLERQYGPTLLRQAEIDILVNLIVNSGIIRKGQFLDMVETVLKQRDNERRGAAGMQT